MTFLYWLITQWDISGKVKIETLTVFHKHMSNLPAGQCGYLARIVEKELT